MVVRRRSSAGPRLREPGRDSGADSGKSGVEPSAAKTRLRLRRPDHHLRIHAGSRADQRPRSELLPFYRAALMLPVGSPVHVRKLKPDGALDFAWSGVVLRCDDEGIVLRAEFNVDLVERGWATFRRGDVFVEFYYFDRLSPVGNAGSSGVAGDPLPDDSPTRFYDAFAISSTDQTQTRGEAGCRC